MFVKALQNFLWPLNGVEFLADPNRWWSGLMGTQIVENTQEIGSDALECPDERQSL
jgi:hypothetical protein